MEDIMYIRRRGLKFQLLRRIVDEDDKIHHVTLGVFPVTCKTTDEIDKKILAKLTKREDGQLEEHLEKHHKKIYTNKPQPNHKELNNLLGDMEAFLIKNSPEKECSDIEGLTALHAKLTDTLCHAGQAPGITATTLKSANKSIAGIELQAEDASIMIKEWVRLRKVLNKQGYTSKWYNLWRVTK